MSLQDEVQLGCRLFLIPWSGPCHPADLIHRWTSGHETGWGRGRNQHVPKEPRGYGSSHCPAWGFVSPFLLWLLGRASPEVASDQWFRCLWRPSWFGASVAQGSSSRPPSSHPRATQGLKTLTFSSSHPAGALEAKKPSRKKERIGFLFSGFLIIACDVSAIHNVVACLVGCPVSS